MALAIGAKGIDLEKVQVHPTGLVDPKEPDAKVRNIIRVLRISDNSYFAGQIPRCGGSARCRWYPD